MGHPIAYPLIEVLAWATRLLRFLQEFAQRRVKLLYGKSVEGRETVFSSVFAWVCVGSDNAV